MSNQLAALRKLFTKSKPMSGTVVNASGGSVYVATKDGVAVVPSNGVSYANGKTVTSRSGSLTTTPAQTGSDKLFIL